jgi:hypothetical protein
VEQCTTRGKHSGTNTRKALRLFGVGLFSVQVVLSDVHDILLLRNERHVVSERTQNSQERGVIRGELVTEDIVDLGHGHVVAALVADGTDDDTHNAVVEFADGLAEALQSGVADDDGEGVGEGVESNVTDERLVLDGEIQHRLGNAEHVCRGEVRVIFEVVDLSGEDVFTHSCLVSLSGFGRSYTLALLMHNCQQHQ